VTEQVGPPATPESPGPGAPKKKSALTRIIVYVVGIAVLAIGGVAYKYLSGDVSTAKVGDCITETVKADASDAKVVGCDKPEAKNKVVGIVSNVSEAKFDAENQTLCEAFPTWENVIWLGKKGGTGDAWCLEPIAK